MPALMVMAASQPFGLAALGIAVAVRGTPIPGDEVALTVDPLRSGAPGGSWNVNKIKYKNGGPIVATQ